MSGTAALPRRRRWQPLAGQVERYALALLARPLLASLLVVLPALLLERLLRLFSLVAADAGSVPSVVRLVLYLVPHYLGLALPASFFAGVYLVVSRLSEGHELDALQAAGVSLWRLTRPFLLVGAVLGAAALVLFGQVQPWSRYLFRSDLHAVTHAAWNAAVPPGEFTRIAEGVTATADAADPATGILSRVFIHRRHGDGTEEITTAGQGRVVASPDGTQLVLELDGGERITTHPDGRVSTLGFGASGISRPYEVKFAGYRPRGADEREMTLPELRRALAEPDPPVARGKLLGELHGRLVRSASLPLLPLLAVPMGLAAKRARRWHGGALAGLILLAYHHGLQLAESMGDVGLMDPRPALWGLFGLFAALLLAAFARAHRHPSEGPFDPALAAIERLGAALSALLPRRRRRAA